MGVRHSLFPILTFGGQRTARPTCFRQGHPQITLIAQILVLEFTFFDYEEEKEDEGDSKNISPRPTFRSNGDKWGMGVRQALFPMPTLGAHPCGGCQLPDAILHGKRSLRPRGRAVQCLAAAGF